MIDERIESSLKELEHQLIEVESARRQVERTTESYDGLKSVTADYVRNIQSMQSELAKVINLIGDDYRTKTTEFGNDRKQIIKSCMNAIEQVKEAAQETTENVAKSIGFFKKLLLGIIGINIVTLAAVIVMALIR